MGLAPYGEAKYVDLIENNVLDIKADGSFRLDLRYFDFCTGLKMTNQAFDTLLGQARREPESELTQFHMDVAASIQKVTEQIIFKIINHAATLSNTTNLCLAGGVALNCVANGKIVDNTCIENIWIQPAAGDDGGALSYAEHPTSDVAKTTAQLIANGNVVGWFQGKMEFGPRIQETRSTIPAVTHVDYTARVQTVDDTNNKAFFQLLTEFDALTGCAVLVNTSFNVRGEPIVCTPEDALSCFMRTGMDYLVLGNFIIDKKAQSKALTDIFSAISFSLD